MAPTPGATWMHREPTAISLVEIATPNIPVRSHRPISENVVNSIPAEISLVTAGSAQAPAQELGDLERAGGGGELGDARGEVAAGRIAGHGAPRGIGAEIAALLAEPAIGGHAVLHRRGELVLGRQPIIDGHDEHPRVLGEPCAEPAVS